MLQLLRLPFLNGLQDVGLLLLRVSLGFSMLLLHGWSKFQNFDSKAAGFPQVFGMPSSLCLSLAVFAEVVCSVLLILGLFTRFAALNLAATMAVAFFIVHKGVFTGPQSGELAFVYLIGAVALVFTGGGKFSADGGR
jgi:putative oxidoreductase